MIVVDLRSFFTVRNVELIEVNDEFIYYAEEKKEEGHNNLFLLEYDRETRRERIVAHYLLDDPAYLRHLYSFDDSILLLLENGGNQVFVTRVNKNTGQETAHLSIPCVGDFVDSRALDRRHLLISTVKNEAFADLFEDYRQETGRARIAYLHDLDTGRRFLVKNEQLSQAVEEHIKIYQGEKGGQLLLLEPFGDEQGKERCYRGSRPLGEDVRDNMWLCPLEEALSAVKAGEEALPLRRIVSMDVSGLARYCGMDTWNLYFKEKHFDTGEAFVCAYHKTTGKTERLASLPGRPGSRYYFDREACRVYRLTEREDSVLVEGVVNSKVRASFERKLGDFAGCIEDRFLITRYVVLDDQGGYAYEYNTIYDVRAGTEECFESKCAVRGNTLVLY